MQNTRWEILQILKRSGGSTVEELAHALSFAPMTVRQHLAILERDGLVTTRENRKGPGRPSHVYSVSPQGEELFPKGYQRLAERLLREISELPNEEIEHLSAQEKLEHIMERMADRVADEYKAEVQGDTLAERVETVTALLGEREGTLSEWTQTEAGFQIQDINCPFQKIAAAEPALCVWHLRLLTRLLQADVDMENCMASGDSCCLYQVQDTSAISAREVGLPLVPVHALRSEVTP